MIKKKDNIWKSFAEEVNGNYIESKFWHSDKAEIFYRDCQITFDNFTIFMGSYNQIYTRIIVRFNSDTNFTFIIYRSNIFTRIAKFFGSKYIEIDKSEFDKAIVVKSNHERRIITLLQNPKIRNFIQFEMTGRIEISKGNILWNRGLSKNEFELSFYVEDQIKDFKKLKALTHFFYDLIDQIIEMNLILLKSNT
jgi:hypothetical protein